MLVDAPAAPVEVRRERLLERLERARPRLLAMVAPAGYGKSTLARQMLAGRGPWGLCDCSHVQSEHDLARRLLRALAEESPERRSSLDSLALTLEDEALPLDERVAAVLEAWREPSSGCVLIERATQCSEIPAAAALLERALASMPEGRSVILCAREDLHLHLTRFAPPHEIVVLRAEELAFDAQEVRAVFAPQPVDDELVERILGISRGWPIAVLLLRRFAAEGRIDALMDHPGDAAFEELHDYFVDRVLASRGDSLADALFACAAIRGATHADVRAALDDENAVAELERFARESPFLSRASDGAFSVHPILATLLVEHNAERRDDLLATAASRHETAGDFVRAAELYHELGDRDSSASALAKHEFSFDRTPSPTFERLLRTFDPIQIARYPRIWAAACLRRLFCIEASALVDEGDLVWRTMPGTASILERFYVTSLRVLMLAGAGRTEGAVLAIDELEAFADRPEFADAPIGAWAAYLRAFVAARVGRLDEAEPVLNALLPLVASLELPAYKTFLTLGADIARVRGERQLERRFLLRAVEISRRSTLQNVAGLALAESAFGAWLGGDDVSAGRLNAELAQCIDRSGALGFAFLSASIAGSVVEPEPIDSLRHVALGSIVAAAAALDEAEGTRRARAALRAAVAYRSPFIEVLASLALASWAPAEFDDAMRRARAAAARCDSFALRESVEAFARRRDGCGFLQPFVERFSVARRRRAPSLEIDLVSGTVRVHGRDAKLSGRETELLFALAARREAVARTHLAALLWPETDEESARNALSVCLHRLRRSVGADAVVRDGEGYRLCDDARVDAWEIEQRMAAIRARGGLDDADRTALARIASRLDARRPASMERWEWFAPQVRRLDAMRVEAAHRLAVDAFERGDAGAALQRAQEILAHDPLDEPARELAIRAHLAMDDRAAAIRQYRHYREILASELQVEPSPALTKMLYS